jgi:hypothetical protein
MVIAWIEQNTSPTPEQKFLIYPPARRWQIGNAQFTNFVSAGQAQV